MSERFIKFIPSEEAMWLLKKKGHAFRLLAIIAESARRVEGDPDGLNVGECFIGGHENYDMTERNYRTAKDTLVKRRHLEIVETCRTRKKATTGSTTVGTKVRLLSSNVWDINLNTTDDRNDDWPTTDRRPTDDKLRKNKNIKKERKQHLPQSAPLIAEFFISLSAFVPSFIEDKSHRSDTQLAAMDSLISLHGEEKVRAAFTFAHKNEFWRAHVHTPIYLKKKFATLNIQMQGDQNGSNTAKFAFDGSYNSTAHRQTKDRDGKPVDTSCYNIF